MAKVHWMIKVCSTIKLEVWRSTPGPVSTEMGDCVRVHFPVPDIYFGM